MSEVPLAARVVEVLADLGEGHSPRYRSGSGCIVAGRTVLTAAHVVEGAVSVKVRSPDKVIYEAALDTGFVGDVDGPGPDLALVELTGPGVDVPAMGLAAVDRASVSGDPVERCHAVGYPVFMERDGPGGGRVRETADAFGHVPVLSGLAGGLLSVQVSSAPRPLPPGRTALGQSQWSGMSGAPVVAGGLLLGVVTEHAPRAGDSAITATPLTALEADPAHPGWGPGVAEPGAWWARLGCSGLGALRRLPAPPVRMQPAYWATVREIHRRTETLVGRQGELAELASFVAGADGYRWLEGGAWAGKTSLLAEAVTVMGDQCDVVCYFLSRRETDADSSHFLAAVVPQLAYLLEEDPPAADSHQYRALWQRAVRRADAEDRDLLLVVDGLDEDLRPPGLPSVAALLPPGAGGRIHVLVSSRPPLDLRRDLPPGHALAQTEPVTIRSFEGGDELAGLAFQEIDDLLSRDDGGLAAEVLGLLTAAAGPLAVADLAAMSASAPQSAAFTRRIRRLVTVEAARSLQSAGLAKGDRYQFAHGSLLEQAQENEDLSDPDYLRRIHQWADGWRAAGWPSMDGAGHGTPRYLLDTYPSTLTEDPPRLAALAGDAGWVTAAIQALGVDAVLAELKTADATAPGEPRLAAMHAVVRGQARHLRDPEMGGDPGFVPRQLCLQAAELGENTIAADCRARQLASGDPGLVLQWTTRRASAALVLELGRTGGWIRAVAVLPDGRVIGGEASGEVLVWDPANPGAGPTELGRQAGGLSALAMLPDGRVASSGDGGRVLAWDPANPGAGPAELGRRKGAVNALAVLPDGRLASVGNDTCVLVWDPADPGAGPVELGQHRGFANVGAVAVLPDGRVASGGDDGQMLVWDPAAPGAAPVELGSRDDRVSSSLAVLPDGRVVSNGPNGEMLVWNPANPEAAPAELGSRDDHVSSLAVLPDGRLVSGGYDSRVLIWDLANPGAAPAELGRHDDRVDAVAVLPDGRVITGGGFDDGRVLVWDPADPGAGPVGLGHRDDRVGAVAVLPDGRVVTGEDGAGWTGPGGRAGGGGRMLVWDPADPGARPAAIGGHFAGVRALAVLPDGRLVSAGFHGEIWVGDPADPGARSVELGSHDRVSSLAVLPDGRVASGGDLQVLVWDPAADPGVGMVELSDGWPIDWVRALAVLPDGRLASAGDHGMRLWDPAEPGVGPAELGRYSGWVNALAVLPDGRLASSGTEGVLIWDPADPAAAPAKLGRPDWIKVLAVLPDGRLASAGDHGVRLWDVQNGPARRLLACSASALAISPSPSGAHLYIGHQGGGFSCWEVRARNTPGAG